RQLLPAGRPELADQEHVERGAERLRHLGPDRDAAAGQRQDNHIGPAGVLTEQGGQTAAGVGPVAEAHVTPPSGTSPGPPRAARRRSGGTAGGRHSTGRCTRRRRTAAAGGSARNSRTARTAAGRRPRWPGGRATRPAPWAGPPG